MKERDFRSSITSKVTVQNGWSFYTLGGDRHRNRLAPAKNVQVDFQRNNVG